MVQYFRTAIQLFRKLFVFICATAPEYCFVVIVSIAFYVIALSDGGGGGIGGNDRNGGDSDS